MEELCVIRVRCFEVGPLVLHQLDPAVGSGVVLLAFPEPAALLDWPEAGARDDDAEARMGRLQEVIRAVRRLRNENRVQERVAVDARVKTADPAPLLEEEALLRRLARLGAGRT